MVPMSGSKGSHDASRYFWSDERSIPDVLLRLLDSPALPEDLRKEMVQAAMEVEERGAVTYPTKARVEYRLHQHRDLISKLVEELDNEEPRG